MPLAELSPWNLLSTEIAFLAFAVLVCVAILFVFAVSLLGMPFWGLSSALHPRLQDAQRRGQQRRARRLEFAQNALDKIGDLVFGIGFLALVGGAVIALWGVRFLVVGVGALLVLGAIGAVAQRVGFIDAS